VSLSELAHVSSVVLTVQYDTTELAWPRSFDLSVGRYVNQMHVVLQEQILPVASQGTRLEYMLERNQVDPCLHGPVQLLRGRGRSTGACSLCQAHLLSLR